MALQELWLSRNILMMLPESFGQLVALQRLYLCRNKLTTLPESFGQLMVSDLTLEDNNLRTLPESFGQPQVLRNLCNDSEVMLVKLLAATTSRRVWARRL